jgi:uncharacterized protein (DUF2235 family)
MKRIVICADGTWNKLDQGDEESGKRRPTNVTKIARAVLARAPDGVDQVVCYHNGVGTAGPLDQVTGGAFGNGIEENIRVLYRFILYNYVEGDELFFFGFSRGAFTVRTLAGFMNRYGLVRKQDDYYVPEMYQCYERNIAKGSPEWQRIFIRSEEPRKGQSRIEKVRDCPPIKFIGVWDTVGALGAPGLIGHYFNGDKFQYHDIELNDFIRYAVHALALDERRKPFQPSIWKKPAGWTGHLEQAWFAGVHSNVGGGYRWDGLANEALHWIAAHAMAQGLALDKDYLSHFEPHFESDLNDSMTAMYRAVGQLIRPVGQHIADGEFVHRSALLRKERGGSIAGANRDRVPYVPPNLANFSADAKGGISMVDTPGLVRQLGDAASPRPQGAV